MEYRMNSVLDTLSQNPTIGFGGSAGGFFASIISTTPIFQFLSAFFGAVIGLVTLIGITKGMYERARKKSGSNS